MKMFSTPPENSKRFIIQNKNRGGLLFKSIEQKNRRGLLFKVKIEEVHCSNQLELIPHISREPNWYQYTNYQYNINTNIKTPNWYISINLRKETHPSRRRPSPLHGKQPGEKNTRTFCFQTTNQPVPWRRKKTVC